MSDEKRVKQSLVEGLGSKINIHLLRIEKLNSEKEQKESEINERIKKAGRNRERTDSEILKKQAKKEERLAKEELTKTEQEYNAKIAEEQEKIKALVQDSKKRIEEERKKAEDKMKALHSDIKSWSEDEGTKKRLKVKKILATSIAELNEVLKDENDETERSKLEALIEGEKSRLLKNEYTKSENDTILSELKQRAKESNEYYEKLSDSLEKLDELEKLQAQLEDMGIETEDKDYSKENSETWRKFLQPYNDYVKKICRPLLSQIEISDFQARIESKVIKLKSDIKNSKGKIDYTAKIEELSSEFDTYYKNLNISKKSELNETLKNAVDKLSTTPNLADELRNEFEAKIIALNTDDLLMLEGLKSISSDMDKKIKEIEDRQNSTYPQEIIDAFNEFDKLCDEVKSEFEKQENVDTERDVYERDFETQRTEWEKAIDNKEEIDVKEIQEKYKVLETRLTVYRENLKNFKLVKDAGIKKVEQAKTDELKKRVVEDLQDIIEDKLDEVIDTIEKFDGTPIDVSELLKIIEEYIIPGKIDLDPPEPFSAEEKARRKEAHDRADKANIEFKKNDKVTREEKKDANDKMVRLDLRLHVPEVTTEDYIKECEDFINEINRIKREQTKGTGTPPINNSKVDKLTVVKIDVNVKAGLYTITMKSGDEIVVPTRKLQDREQEKEAADIRAEYGIGTELLDPDKVKTNFRDAAKNISGKGLDDKRTETGKTLAETGLVDPVIAAILVELDSRLEQISNDLKNTNKSKYGKFILEEEQDTEELFKIIYDFKGAKEVKNKDMIGSMKYLRLIGKNAKKAEREDMLVGYTKRKPKTKQEPVIEDEHADGEHTDEEHNEEKPTELHYKDLSERAKRVYDDVKTLSKDEKKAKIGEEALKGHITPEDHKQLHEIFDLGPLPVAEKKPNLLKRAWNGLKDRASALFHRKDEERENNSEDEELENDEEQTTEEEKILNKNIQVSIRLFGEYEKLYSDLTDDLDKAEFSAKFWEKIQELQKNIKGELGKKYSYIENCAELSRKMNSFRYELKEKRNIEKAMQIHLSGNRDGLLLLTPEEQKAVTAFLDLNIAAGLYSKEDLKIMKSLIDARIAMGENAEELYKNLNIDEKDQEFLNGDGQRED